MCLWYIKFCIVRRRRFLSMNLTVVIYFPDSTVASLCVSLALLITLLPFMCSCFCAQSFLGSLTHNIIVQRNIFSLVVWNTRSQSRIADAHTDRPLREAKANIFFSTDLLRSKKIKPHCYFACRNDNTLFWISPPPDEINCFKSWDTIRKILKNILVKFGQELWKSLQEKNIEVTSSDETLNSMNNSTISRK